MAIILTGVALSGVVGNFLFFHIGLTSFALRHGLVVAIALAAGLVRSARRLEAAGWRPGIIRATFIPFALTFLAAILVGAVLAAYRPGARTIMEALFGRG